jgi:hypothetical protein
MIREAYVSFETAKLLKEKGFDAECFAWWSTITFPQVIHSSVCRSYNYCNTVILAPTQQIVLRWLREKNIDIITFHEILDKECYWFRIEKKCENLLYTEFQQEPIYDNYEDAIEAAIKYCLENLKVNDYGRL